MKTKTRRKSFYVAVPKGDGGFDLYPIHEWFRQHPEQLPEGHDASETSRQLRGALKKNGWKVEEAEVCFRPKY